jgi:hypothetical protein
VVELVDQARGLLGLTLQRGGKFVGVDRSLRRADGDQLRFKIRKVRF